MHYLKIAAAAAVGLAVAGCATANVPNDVSLSDLKSAGVGAVLYYFPRLETCTSAPTIDLGTRDPTTGLWEVSERMRGQSLVMQELSAGEYGVLQIRCLAGIRRDLTMSATRAPIRINDLFSRLKFISPIVTFKVGAGEVVNIGAIRAVELPDSKFTTVISPIPPSILAVFQAARPEIAKKLISRPMTPPDAQPAAPEAAPKRR